MRLQQSRVLVQLWTLKEKTVKTEASKFRYLDFTGRGNDQRSISLHSFVASFKSEPAGRRRRFDGGVRDFALDLRADLAIMSGTKVAGTAGNNGAGLMGFVVGIFCRGLP